MRFAICVAVAVVFVGCPPPQQQPTGPGPTGEPTPVRPAPTAEPTGAGSHEPAPGGEPAPSTGAADGESCLSADDCESGICEGQGCTDDRPGTCMSRKRVCTRDLRAYCGCDGQTFHGSGSCPGRRYASRGECKQGSAEKAANGSVCSSGDDCASGICEGHGCGPDAGICMSRKRPCTADLRPYCGCDGQTFQSSGSCANRLYQHKGACKP